MGTTDVIYCPIETELQYVLNWDKLHGCLQYMQCVCVCVWHISHIARLHRTHSDIAIFQSSLQSKCYHYLCRERERERERERLIPILPFHSSHPFPFYSLLRSRPPSPLPPVAVAQDCIVHTWSPYIVHLSPSIRPKSVVALFNRTEVLYIPAYKAMKVWWHEYDTSITQHFIGRGLQNAR